MALRQAEEFIFYAVVLFLWGLVWREIHEERYGRRMNFYSRENQDGACGGNQYTI